jgi:hypothetical protein
MGNLMLRWLKRRNKIAWMIYKNFDVVSFSRVFNAGETISYDNTYYTLKTDYKVQILIDFYSTTIKVSHLKEGLGLDKGFISGIMLSTNKMIIEGIKEEDIEFTSFPYEKEFIKVIAIEAFNSKWKFENLEYIEYNGEKFFLPKYELYTYKLLELEENLEALVSYNLLEELN